MTNSGLINEGRYLAKPTEWGITKTKSGKPNVFIAFKLEATGKNITWFGSLNQGKATEITIRTLVNCGFKFDKLTALDRSDALDTKTNVSLTIEHEEREKEGTTHTIARVSWVNKINSLKADKKDVATMLSGIDLRGALMAEMMEQGVQMQKTSAIQEASQEFDANDIPF